MLRYIILRILESIPTLLILITISFFVMRLAPGNPFTNEKAYSPEVMKNIEAKYHLDKPLLTQYGFYLRQLVKGDLGPSFKYKDFSVNDLLSYALPLSLKLGGYALILSVFFGVLLGMISALNQNSWLDYFTSIFSMIGMVIPTFVIAPILVLFFSVFLGWLPSGSWGEGKISYLILPVIALSLPYITQVSRIMRSSMIEVMSSSFIRTARAKGLSKSVIVLRHAFKPAILPVISYLGPACVGIITGSIVIETIFVLPGIGQLFVNGALNRDYGLVLSLTILVGFLTILFNLIVDIIYMLLDPRIKY